MKKDTKPQLPIHRLEEILCGASNIPLEHIMGPSRDADVVAVRHMLWYILHDHMGHSYPHLARLYDRDHTTVIHGAKKMRGTDAAERVLTEVRRVAPDLIKERLTGGRPIARWEFGSG